MSKSVPEIIGEYLAYMVTLPFTGFACLLAGDSHDEWCTTAEKGLIGWGVVLAPLLLIGFWGWSAQAEAARSNERELAERLRLSADARRLKDEFQFLNDLSKQDQNVHDRLYIARRLVYTDIWSDLVSACHLIKRNAQAGSDNFYWLRADEILREANAQIAKGA
jgi:hypothetical protein